MSDHLIPKDTVQLVIKGLLPKDTEIKYVTISESGHLRGYDERPQFCGITGNWASSGGDIAVSLCHLGKSIKYSNAMLFVIGS